MNTIIHIPNVNGDEKIGSACNHLFSVINKTDNTTSDEVVWDFGNCTFFHPFFLAPLAIYKKKCSKKISCINISKQIDTYFNLVHFNNLLTIDSETDLEEVLKGYLNKTYIPICCFDMCSNNVDALQSIIQKIIEKQSHADSRITTPLSYFLGELICNIKEHSDSSSGYIFSQYLPKERCIDICIADSGITVYGSYIKAQKYIDEIGDDEAIALKKANEGYSTKNLPNAENRGYGITSTKNMLVDGLKGAFFMLSGNAFHRHDNDNSVFIRLPKSINWEGTIILLRIPIYVDEQFDYMKYIQ